MRSDLFHRPLSKTLITDFFGGVAHAEVLLPSSSAPETSPATDLPVDGVLEAVTVDGGQEQVSVEELGIPVALIQDPTKNNTPTVIISSPLNESGHRSIQVEYPWSYEESTNSEGGISGGIRASLGLVALVCLVGLVARNQDDVDAKSRERTSSE